MLQIDIIRPSQSRYSYNLYIIQKPDTEAYGIVKISGSSPDKYEIPHLCDFLHGFKRKQIIHKFEFG